ncbi:MAG TPA: restriction endonuclease [Drouetiella sp.]
MLSFLRAALSGMNPVSIWVPASVLVAALTAIMALAVLLAVAKFVLARVRKSRRRRSRKNIMRRIDTMSGAQFELLLADYFRDQGYRVELTQTTGDFGADLILRKGKQRIVVQAKRWRRSVGVSSVQEVIAARQYYKATDALLVTNSALTRNAIKLAAGTDVTVWNRSCLIEKFSGASLTVGSSSPTHRRQ